MDWYPVIFTTLLVVVIVVWVWTCRAIPKTPPVEPQEAIAEEARRERLELHNTALHYAELQMSPPVPGCNGPLYTAKRVQEMMASAFRSGAQWQQRRP
jgi:hypothetical protein